MRFLMMVKSKEGQGQPPAALMQAIAQSGAEASKNGTMVLTGGLYPASQGDRVRVDDGKVSVLDGPFTEAKEVVGGFAIFELKSREEALEAAKHFMELHRQHWPGWVGETEIRRLFDGPPDFAASAKNPA
jgi:hypothetical protein